MSRFFEIAKRLQKLLWIWNRLILKALSYHKIARFFIRMLVMITVSNRPGIDQMRGSQTELLQKVSSKRIESIWCLLGNAKRL